MGTIYYVVTKQLQSYDGFEETNGWKEIDAYSIKDSKLIKLCELEILNDENSQTELLEHLEENKLIDSTQEIKLVQL